MLLGLGAIVAGIWTLFNYRKSRRAEAAHWLQGVFKDFYLEDRFRQIKLVIEYDYEERLAPLLERRLTNRDVPLSDEDTLLLEQLDMLLNYFEHVIYLEREGHMTKRDRHAVFEYWFDLMAADKAAAIRRYATRFGFERVTSVLGDQTADYVALYGSLMRDEDIDDRPDLTEHLTFVGEATLKGKLVDLGDYPGLIPGDGEVHAEYHEVNDFEVFKAIDRFERYEATDPGGSLYVRHAVRMLQPKLDAWIYVFNGDTSAAEPVAHGDWRRHLQAKNDKRV